MITHLANRTQHSHLQALRQQLRAYESPAAGGLRPAQATGFRVLDEALPQRGWQAGVTELLTDSPSSRLLPLLLPTLKRCQQNRWLVLVNPPAIPYAPGLQCQGVDLSRLLVIKKQTADNAAWACEQCLQSRSCGVIVAWFEPRKPQQLRRLQLLAKAQNSLLFLCRPLAALQQSSAAQARIALQPEENGLRLKFHKLQGEIRRPELSVTWPQALHVEPSCGA